jgi:hypothetical protein
MTCGHASPLPCSPARLRKKAAPVDGRVQGCSVRGDAPPRRGELPHGPTSPRRHGDRRRAMQEGPVTLLAMPRAPHLFPISSLYSSLRHSQCQPRRWQRGVVDGRGISKGEPVGEEGLGRGGGATRLEGPLLHPTSCWLCFACRSGSAPPTIACDALGF